jgi:SARP family transcriptional regulator, regulator of embCAB operon
MADRVEEGRVVGCHVLADEGDHLVVGLAPGDVPALATDQPCHLCPPSPVVRPPYCQDVGVTLAPGALRIQLCGPLVVERDGNRLDALLPGRQGRLLLSYLVVNRHRQVPRDELAEALWPEPDPVATTDARLNPLLSKLRRVLGADAVDGRAVVRLRLGDAWVDLEAAGEAVHRAESSVAQGDWARAWGPAQVALFVAERGFLAGEDAPWIDEVRRDLAVLHVRALECYAAAELGIGGAELAGAVRAGRQLTRLAPLRESGYRYLMEALAAQGNVAEALRVFTEMSDHLRDELGVSPSAPTRELYSRLIATT